MEQLEKEQEEDNKERQDKDNEDQCDLIIWYIEQGDLE
jgi:hypothetical protein